MGAFDQPKSSRKDEGVSSFGGCSYCCGCAVWVYATACLPASLPACLPACLPALCEPLRLQLLRAPPLPACLPALCEPLRLQLLRAPALPVCLPACIPVCIPAPLRLQLL